MPQPALDPVASDRRTYRLAHDEARTGRTRTGFGNARVRHVQLSPPQVCDEGRPPRPAPAADRAGELVAPLHSAVCGQHLKLGGKVASALGPARREDGPAGARAHAQPEAVGLGTTPVVRLEGALGHWGSRQVLIRSATPRCLKDVVWSACCSAARTRRTEGA